MSTVLLQDYDWISDGSYGYPVRTIRINVSYDYERTVKGMRWKFYINAKLIKGTCNIPVLVSLGDSCGSTQAADYDIYQHTLKSDYGSWGGSDGVSWETGWIERTGDFSSQTKQYCISFENPIIKGRSDEHALPENIFVSINCIRNQSKLTFYGYPKIGQQHHIQVVSDDSRYTHKLIFTLEKWSQSIELPSGSTTTDGYWTPDIEGFATNSPDSSRPKCNWQLEVYLEGTKIGYTEGTLYIYVTGVAPNVTISITDESEHFKKYGYYLLGQSVVGVSLDSKAQYGATVDSERVIVGTEEIIPPGTVTLPSNFNGNVTAIVTDSRTEQTTAEKTLTVRTYTAPSVKKDSDGTTQFSVHRVTNEGIADDTGDYCRVDFTVVYDKLEAVGSTAGRNTPKLWVKWEANDGTISGSQEITVNGYEFSSSYTFYADIEHSFTVSLEMQDDIMGEDNPAIRSIMLSTAQVIMDWKVGGGGIGLGKVSENLNAVDLNPEWDFNMGDISHLKFNGKSLSMPVNQVIKEADSGIWHYRCWQDGTAECVGKFTVDNLTTSKSYLGGYVNSLYFALNYKQQFPVFKYGSGLDYGNEPIEAYIVGTTSTSGYQTSDWLSLTVGGKALEPTDGQLYIIKTDGIYKNEVYGFTGTYYIPYTRSLFAETPTCIAQIYGEELGINVTPAIIAGIDAPTTDETMNFVIITGAAVSSVTYTISMKCSGLWKE
jgi:hypothetical protein